MAIGTGGIMYIAFQQISDLFDSFMADIERAGSGKGFDSLGQQLNNMTRTTKKSKEEISEAYKSGLGKDIDSLVRSFMSEEQLTVAKYNDQLELLKHYQNNVKNLTELDKKILANLEIKMAKKLKDDLAQIRKDEIIEKAKERADELKRIKEHYDKQLQIIKTGKFAELELEQLTKEQIKDLTKATGRELISELA